MTRGMARLCFWSAQPIRLEGQAEGRTIAAMSGRHEIPAVETIFYFLDGFSLTVPGDHLETWEQVKKGDREGFLIRPAHGFSVDLGLSYRCEVRRT